jgi:hypothetical protein
MSDDPISDYDQYVWGMDYTFHNGLYFMLEYFRNNAGEANQESYTFQDWMSFLGGETEGLGRDYAFFGQRYPLARLLEWATYAIGNLSDRSGMVLPWCTYSLSDDAEVQAVLLIPFGEAGSEYGQMSSGGFVRLRAYF